MARKRVTFILLILICAAPPGLVVMNLTAAEAHLSSPERQAQSDRPVEQTRKNIQVLKGLPESQLFPLMNFGATSLGVKCDYCHVKNPGKNPQTGGDASLARVPPRSAAQRQTRRERIQFRRSSRPMDYLLA